MLTCIGVHSFFLMVSTNATTVMYAFILNTQGRIKKTQITVVCIVVKFELVIVPNAPGISVLDKLGASFCCSTSI